MQQEISIGEAQSARPFDSNSLVNSIFQHAQMEGI